MTQNSPTYRDDELGAALRSLETPEHRPHFDFDLQRRLAEQPAPRGARRLRVSRRAGRRWARRPVIAFAVAVLAALAIALPLADRIPGVGSTETASAAEVQAQVRASLGSLQSLSGVLVHRSTLAVDAPKASETRWRFLVTSEGDLRLAGPGDGEILTYDASEGIVRSAQRSASVGGDTIFYAERRGVAPGPPDVGPPTWVLPAEFGAFVRALLAAQDPRVREVEYDGREAWALEVDAVPNAIVPEYTGDRFAITVDRETGVPVRVVERKAGAVLRELRVEQLQVDEELSPGAFRLQFPARAEVSRSNDGFRRVGLEEIRSIVGYSPLVPRWVPAGYELAEVAVAERADPTGKEAGNPVSRNVVSLSYRRGFDQLVVTTREAGTGSWSDPVATGEGYIDNPRVVTITSGVLRGLQAEAVIEPRGVPHAWAQHGGLVVTVAGGVSDRELIRVVESVEARP
jgi:hypothetical protein